MKQELTVFCEKHPNYAVRLGTCHQCDKEDLDNIINSLSKQGITNGSFGHPNGYKHKFVYTNEYFSSGGAKKILIQFCHTEKELNIPCSEEDEEIEFPVFIPSDCEGEILRLMPAYKIIEELYFKAKKDLSNKINSIVKHYSAGCNCYMCQEERNK